MQAQHDDELQEKLSGTIAAKRDNKQAKKRSKRLSKLTTRRKKTPVEQLAAMAETRKVSEAAIFAHAMPTETRSPPLSESELPHKDSLKSGEPLSAKAHSASNLPQEKDEKESLVLDFQNPMLDPVRDTPNEAILNQNQGSSNHLQLPMIMTAPGNEPSKQPSVVNQEQSAQFRGLGKTSLSMQSVDNVSLLV